MSMDREDMSTRSQILAITAEMLETTPSDKLRISDVAESSHVAVPTIYYHFNTRTRLIAQAQLLGYVALSEPNRTFLGLVETAVEDNDRDLFWRQIEDLMTFAWSRGQPDTSWRLLRMLLDIWSDENTRQEFFVFIDERVERWSRAMEEAKARGWMNADIEAAAPVIVYWAASLGQSFILSPQRPRLDGRSVSSFLVNAMRRDEEPNEFTAWS